MDAKLIERYGIDISKWARARRKRAGLANMQYIRYERFFVLMATKGKHAFFQSEDVKDIRRAPLKFAGYSISYRRSFRGTWHSSVRIDRERFQGVKSHLSEMAAHRSNIVVVNALRSLCFAPFAPIRRQYLTLLRLVNRRREQRGFGRIPSSVLRLKRTSVIAFRSKEPGMIEAPGVSPTFKSAWEVDKLIQHSVDPAG